MNEMRKLMEAAESLFESTGNRVEHEDMIEMLEPAFEKMNNAKKMVFFDNLLRANTGMDLDPVEDVPGFDEVLNVFEDTREPSQVNDMLKVIAKFTGIRARWVETSDEGYYILKK